jgi:alanyl-tRNA synthetase
MTANELRSKYLNFFRERGHAIIPSSSLIPEHDPSVLFITAGMHPLVPYLLGEKHPAGRRLVDVQKSIRTTDIDDVGDNRHLTFFEMLGNWSLGDYFKKEAIEWSWEFLTDANWLGLDPLRIYVSVFTGDENSPIDEESVGVWQAQFAKAGIKAEVLPFGQKIGGNKNIRIFLLPSDDNWWGPAGQTGPCGPCSEMFYDVVPEKGALQKSFYEEMGSGRIMEIWNDVFMQFNKTADGKFEKLFQRNVDTGMGLERTISVLNGKTDTFDNELFYPIFKITEELSGKKYGESPDVTRAMRIIADHIKASAFLLAEKLEPSNVERGYVLRRLIRRAVRYGKQLGINEIFTFKIANIVSDIYRDVYPEVQNARPFIEEQLVREEEKFGKTLEKGLKQFLRTIEDHTLTIDNVINGEAVFHLYDTYGFPLEFTKELAQERSLKIDEEGFKNALAKHQELSRAGAEQKFKGGLADHSEQVVKYHTAAHLALAALRQVLGSHVTQKGSNITAERLRFDFSQPQKMTAEQIKEVEDSVNQAIKLDAPVNMEELSLEEAKAQGAMGVFESKYGEKVKVYTIRENGKIISKEICGGPHVDKTGVLGHFKIVKEESASAGVRRIKAVLE